MQKITIKLKLWDDHIPPIYIGPPGYENIKRKWLPWNVQGRIIGDWGWFRWLDSLPGLFSVTHIPSGRLAKANLPKKMAEKIIKELDKSCKKWSGRGNVPKPFLKNIQKIIKNVQSSQIPE